MRGNLKEEVKQPQYHCPECGSDEDSDCEREFDAYHEVCIEEFRCECGATWENHYRPVFIETVFDDD